MKRLHRCCVSGLACREVSDANPFGPPKHKPAVEPRDLTNVEQGTPKVTWFMTQDVHPSLRFYRWATKHCDMLPDDRVEYYRHLLRQETKSCLLLNIPYEVVNAIAAGYNKAKWVLEKYDVKMMDPIPSPFDVFYTSEMYEERKYAFMRSNALKEYQAFGREDAPEGRSSFRPRGQTFSGSLTKMDKHGGGMDMHAEDLPTPGEEDFSPDTYEKLYPTASHGEAVDDLITSQHKVTEQRRAMEDNEELYGFEDEDEEFVAPPRRSPVM